MRKDDIVEEDRDGPSSRMQHREQNEKERANEACGKTYFMTRERKSSSHQEIPTARKVYQVYCVPTNMTKELIISFMVVKHTTRVASQYSNLREYGWERAGFSETSYGDCSYMRLAWRPQLPVLNISCWPTRKIQRLVKHSIMTGRIILMSDAISKDAFEGLQHWESRDEGERGSKNENSQ